MTIAFLGNHECSVNLLRALSCRQLFFTSCRLLRYCSRSTPLCQNTTCRAFNASSVALPPWRPRLPNSWRGDSRCRRSFKVGPAGLPWTCMVQTSKPNTLSAFPVISRSIVESLVYARNLICQSEDDQVKQPVPQKNEKRLRVAIYVIIAGYGMTENAAGNTVSPREGSKTGSVGRIIPMTQMKVRDWLYFCRKIEGAGNRKKWHLPAEKFQNVKCWSFCTLLEKRFNGDCSAEQMQETKPESSKRSSFCIEGRGYGNRYSVGTKPKRRNLLSRSSGYEGLS